MTSSSPAVSSGFVRPYAAATPPEVHPVALVHGLRCGKGFQRALTDRERLALALTTAAPTGFFTLDSADMSRAELPKAWDRLIKRLRRALHPSRPLIYLAVPARANATGAGYHVHGLLWEYIHRNTLAKHAREVGFGSEPYIEGVPSPITDALGAVRVLTYVLGQDEGVFGSRVHQRHLPRAAASWALLHPQRGTLRRECPELFTALEVAESPLVSDEMLVQRSPLFSKTISREYREGVDLAGSTG